MDESVGYILSTIALQFHIGERLGDVLLEPFSGIQIDGGLAPVNHDGADSWVVQLRASVEQRRRPQLL